MSDSLQYEVNRPQSVDFVPPEGVRKSAGTFNRTEIQEISHENPYVNSSLISTLKERKVKDQPIRIAFLDIDSTLTGNPAEAIKVRELLDRQGYTTVFITSRTEEMVMGKDEFTASHEMQRPAPHLGVNPDGKRVTTFPDEIAEFAGLYNGDIIVGTTGSQIYIHQNGENTNPGGYKQDKDYDHLQQRELSEWRQHTIPIVKEIIQGIDSNGTIVSLSPIEDPSNFQKGITDVAPPETRIQVNFESSNGEKVIRSTGSSEGGQNVAKDVAKTPFAKMQEFQKRFEDLKDGPKAYRDEQQIFLAQMEKEFDAVRKGGNPERYKLVKLEASDRYRTFIQALKEKYHVDSQLQKHLQNIRLTNDSNPEKGRFGLYITPNKGYKARSVENIIQHVIQEVNIPKDQVETLIVGDSFPDVNMGLYGGTGTKSTFLLVGGSRLKPVFTDYAVHEFAGVKMDAIKKRLTPIADEKNHYPKLGYYNFNAPLIDQLGGNRTVILGEDAFPGTIGPQTLHAYLEQLKND